MTQVQELKIGDRIYPPKREIQVWMNRRLQEKHLEPSALLLTITDIQEASPDKKGRWILITCRHEPEWLTDYVNPDPAAHPFKFKARPETSWDRF